MLITINGKDTHTFTQSFDVVAQTYQFTFCHTSVDLFLGAIPRNKNDSGSTIDVSEITNGTLDNMSMSLCDSDLDDESLPDVNDTYSVESDPSSSRAASTSPVSSSSSVSLLKQPSSRLSKLLRALSNPRTPSPPPLVSFRKSQKRTADGASQSPSPPPSPAKKKARMTVKSAIGSAITNGKPKGLMKFFGQCTKEEHNAQVQRFTEEANADTEADTSRSEAIKRAADQKLTEDARMRKQKERKRKQEDEVRNGERSPGGTKRKVSALQNPPCSMWMLIQIISALNLTLIGKTAPRHWIMLLSCHGQLERSVRWRVSRTKSPKDGHARMKICQSQPNT